MGCKESKVDILEPVEPPQTKTETAPVNPPKQKLPSLPKAIKDGNLETVKVFKIVFYFNRVLFKAVQI